MTFAIGLLVAAAGADCYEQPWRVAIVAALILSLAIPVLFRSRVVARFVVENLMGPWRVDPVARTEGRESIDAWVSIVRLMLIPFAVFAILIAVGVTVDSFICG